MLLSAACLSTFAALPRGDALCFQALPATVCSIRASSPLDPFFAVPAFCAPIVKSVSAVDAHCTFPACITSAAGIPRFEAQCFSAIPASVCCVPVFPTLPVSSKLFALAARDARSVSRNTCHCTQPPAALSGGGGSPATVALKSSLASFGHVRSARSLSFRSSAACVRLLRSR